MILVVFVNDIFVVLYVHSLFVIGQVRQRIVGLIVDVVNNVTRVRMNVFAFAFSRRRREELQAAHPLSPQIRLPRLSDDGSEQRFAFFTLFGQRKQLQKMENTNKK